MIAMRSCLLARLAAFGAVVLWGLSFIATKAALREVSPITLIFTRFALGTGVLLMILKMRRQSVVPPRRALPTLILMGFTGIFVHQMLQVHGLTLTTAVRTGWLIGLVPIWSAALSAVVLGETFDARRAVGLLFGTVGTLLVITRGEISSRVLVLPATLGDLLILASTLNWAIYTILGRKTLRALGSSRTTAAAMLVGWVMLVPFFLGTAGWHEYGSLSSRGLGSIIFLGVGCSGLGYLFWYTALEFSEASKVAAFLYLEPLVTVAAAVAFLGEPIPQSIAVGGLLVLAGVFIVQRGVTPTFASRPLLTASTVLKFGFAGRPSRRNNCSRLIDGGKEN